MHFLNFESSCMFLHAAMEKYQLVIASALRCLKYNKRTADRKYQADVRQAAKTDDGHLV